MRKLKFISFVLVLSMMMGILSIGISASANYCNSYFEDFSDPSVLSTATTTPWSYTSGGSYSNPKIEGGVLTADNAGSYKTSIITFNGMQTNGAFDCSFDLSMNFAYGATTDSSNVTFTFNRQGTATKYYSLVFRYNEWTKYGIPAKSVSLMKTNNSTVTVLATTAYSQMPYQPTLTRNFHVDLKYGADGGITVDCKDINNDVSTRIFENVYDSASPYTSGGISIRDLSYITMSVDNFLLNNNSFTFKDAKYNPVDNNGISAKSNVYVPDGFSSANVFSALYDTDNKLVSVSKKTYTDTDVINGMINHQSTLETEGKEISKVKLFMWDSSIDAKPYSISADAVFDELYDVNVPAFEPANITRDDVPLRVYPKPIPSDVADNVYPTYPDGRMKAVVMSFDDITSDYNFVLPVLNQNELKGTFAINYKDAVATSGGFIGLDMTDPDNPVEIKADKNTLPIVGTYNNILTNMYQGHEVASHTLNHKSEGNLSKDDFRFEIGSSKIKFENIFNKEVGGFVRAGGTNAPDPSGVAPADWRIAYIQNAGYRYVRYAPLIYPTLNGNNIANFTFDLPYNFHEWMPTMKATQEFDVGKATQILRVDALNRFIDLDVGNRMRIIHAWGHATEMGTVEQDSTTKKRYLSYKSNNYDPFVVFCETLAQNSDKIWNPTCLELVDYVNATRLLEYEKDGDTITVTNPSAAITVFVNLKGEVVSIAPGGSVTK